MTDATDERIVGPTSLSNRVFVERLGDCDSLVASFARSTRTLAMFCALDVSLARHTGTDWPGAGRDRSQGRKQEGCNALARIVKRNKDWGRGGIETRVGQDTDRRRLCAQLEAVIDGERSSRTKNMIASPAPSRNRIDANPARWLWNSPVTAATRIGAMNVVTWPDNA